MNPGNTGLLLLNGGQSRRMGVAKHALAHPEGGTWGGYLVGIFESVFPGGPVQVLGEALPDRPGLPVVPDEREGPAKALKAWAALEVPAPHRWWVVACDQVRWTSASFAAWARRAETADPQALHWVLARHGGHLQPFGSWLPASLRPAIATAPARSLIALAESVPHLILPSEGPEWMDVDTPEERQRFERDSRS